MQKMFQSATLKLTAWYLVILMAISLIFSVVIYQLNYREVNFRLENLQQNIISNGITSQNPFSSFQTNILNTGPGSFIFDESRKASDQMILSLFYINLVLLVAGGLGAFFLARRTLRPIAEAHEAQSRFTSDASHELRTPLSAMKTELEVNLRDPHLPADEARELLESNLEEVNKLIDLSEMLLHLSRLDHDKLEMNPVDITALLNELLKRYSAQNNRFIVSARKKARTAANEPAVIELMGILIDNALKYSPEGTPIHIRVFTQRGSIGFEIKNKGDQIPADKLPHLFERFYRLDSSRTGNAQHGYGLGLSIAKKIVILHHGELTVSSTKYETVFTFLLPINRKGS